MTIAIHRSYESVSDWYKQCHADETHPLTLRAKNHKKSSRSEQTWWTPPFGNHHRAGSSHYDWCKTETRAEALALAELGWPEGRAKLAAALERARPVLRAAPIKAAAWDVAGAYPFVPAAVAGDPLCMANIGEQERRTRPILRLVTEQWNSAGVSSDQIITRGAALLAHIDRLEDTDIRCEVTLRYSASNCSAGKFKGQYHKEHEINYLADIVAKRADEPLDVDRMAFLLLHPSALRRLFFGSMATLEDGGQAMWLPYCGSPPTESARKIESNQILIPSGNEWTSCYDDAASAARQIGDFLRDGIKSMGNMGFLAESGNVLDQEAA